MGKKEKLRAGSSGSNLPPEPHQALTTGLPGRAQQEPPPQLPEGWEPHMERSRPPPRQPGRRRHGRGVAARSRWPILLARHRRGHASEDACARLLVAPQRGSRLRAGTAAAARTALPSSHADGHGHPSKTPLGERLPAPPGHPFPSRVFTQPCLRTAGSRCQRRLLCWMRCGG